MGKNNIVSANIWMKKSTVEMRGPHNPVNI